MGLSGDLLGGFRGAATIEATEAAALVKIYAEQVWVLIPFL